MARDTIVVNKNWTCKPCHLSDRLFFVKRQAIKQEDKNLIV